MVGDLRRADYDTCGFCCKDKSSRLDATWLVLESLRHKSAGLGCLSYSHKKHGRVFIDGALQ
jgi:hypothetical protein